MAISIIVIVCVAALAAGYFTYGRFLARRFELDDSRKTPAVELNDGIDYVPAKAPLLLGQHFSAIAAAGPIVGPILAAMLFGWVPPLLWIVFGAIFIGGVHDFSSLVASVRHKAASVGEIVKQHMSSTSHVLFMIFVWFALSYVIIAFTDITAQTFTYADKARGGEAFGPGVAVSSLLYLFVAVVMGLVLFRYKVSLWAATAVFLPFVFLAIWVGTVLPPSWEAALLKFPVKGWETALLVYCGVASLIPMWLLLQPRGYLGGWFLYLTMAVALLGALFGGYKAEYPAFNMAVITGGQLDKLIFPVLFITVACGAISGFHGIVSGGTTSKQIARESDTRSVGYGAMILEGVVAVLAIATVMMLAKSDAALKADPNVIYANGLARYLSIVHIDYSVALSFALLAFSTFVYDTLDVCTRLARYILQELFGWKSFGGAILATLLTLAGPFCFLLITQEKAYKVAWPIFGTSNQLLASLTLLAISVWLWREGKNALFTLIPMFFMLAVTLTSLVLQILPLFLKWSSIVSGTFPNPKQATTIVTSAVVGFILLLLSIWLLIESIRVIAAARRNPAAVKVKKFL